ncbi:MAG: hypothetical protein D3920_05365 [Candidatus Electrothrix sp. AW2]|nr:hypothetical protein [Candidatus Electrothrix gigas]
MHSKGFILLGIAFRIALFLGLIAITLYQLRVAFIAQTVYSDIATKKEVRKYQNDPLLLVAYGKEESALGHHEKARKWFQKALYANPVYIPAWLNLAELENDVGNINRSLEILNYLDDLMQGVLRWRWEKAMLAYLLGREEMLQDDLSWLLQQKNLTRQTKQKVLNFVFSLWPEPAELVKKMGKENSTSLFVHAVRMKNIDTASFLWTVTDHTLLEKKQVLQYINLLINKQEINKAALLWQKYYPNYPNNNLLYNGNFSLPLLQGGFGWRIWERMLKKQGIEATTEGSALHLHFTGKQNINLYHIEQIIPLSAGRTFKLTGEMRSKNLTTDQRPFLQLIGRKCSMRFVTEMVKSNQDWTQFSLHFTVPTKCNQGVELRLCRLPSKKIDSLISGDFWITNLSLQNVSASTFQ